MSGSKKREKEPLLPESDENFSYIAGYTPAGFPYGVTWEEAKKAESNAEVAKVIPQQARPVALSEILGEMQMLSDSISIYYRRSTGEFIPVSDEYLWLAEREEGEDLVDRPEWEQEAIQQTREVIAHLGVQDYVPLPSRHDIHEYSIMESFCHTVEPQKTANDLIRAISGRGAFRRFKDAVHRHSLQEQWYRFKDEAYLEIARDWCKENSIIWQEAPSGQLEVFPEPITALPQADIPIEGITAYLSQSQNHQIVFMQFEKNVPLPEHCHAAQVGFVLEGKIELTVSGVTTAYTRGDRYYIPAGALHSAKIFAGYADITFFNEPGRYKLLHGRQSNEKL